MTLVYLDNNATTPLDPVVVEAMAPFFSDRFGNPSSTHTPGLAARKSLEQARAQIASHLRIQPDEIFFNSGGTEGDNHVIFGSTLGKEPRDTNGTILTSTIEHPAIEAPCRQLEQSGIRVVRLPVGPDGAVRVEDFSKALEKESDVRLVSLMLANNETGSIQPVREVASLCRIRGIPIHTDAVGAFGKMPVLPGELDVDALTLSAHKFHGPKGAGLLYVRRGTPLHPLLVGGGQERTMRPGTECVAHAVALGTAIERTCEKLDASRIQMTAQRDLLETRLRELVPGARRSTEEGFRLCNTLSMILPGFRGDELTRRLDAEGIAVSAGAACHEGSAVSRLSRVLLAGGLSEEEASSTLRISLSRMTTDREVTRACQAFERVLRS